MRKWEDERKSFLVLFFIDEKVAAATTATTTMLSVNLPSSFSLFFVFVRSFSQSIHSFLSIYLVPRHLKQAQVPEHALHERLFCFKQRSRRCKPNQKDGEKPFFYGALISLPCCSRTRKTTTAAAAAAFSFF